MTPALHLTRQLRFLEVSCREYDAGHHDEAVRIAASLANIMHDGSEPDSHSILRQLGRKDVRLRSTCLTYRKDWLFWPCPNITSVSLHPQRGIFHCIPNLGDRGTPSFPLLCEWWSKTIYRRGPIKVSRKDVVLDARNRDGGGHVGLRYTVKYQEMIDGRGMSITLRPDGGEELMLPLQEIHFATLRQLGYEALHSPELLALAPDYRPSRSCAEHGLRDGGDRIICQMLA